MDYLRYGIVLIEIPTAATILVICVGLAFIIGFLVGLRFRNEKRADTGGQDNVDKV